MKKIFILLLVAGCSFSLFAQENDSSANTREELLVGVKITPPFIMENEDGYTGVSIDFWESIASNLGLKYKYVQYEMADLLDAVESGKVDICISPLTVTSERLKKFDFMQPFYITNLTIGIKIRNDSFGKSFFSIGLLRTIGWLVVILVVLGIILWLAERTKYSDKSKRGVGGIIHFILYLSWLKKRSSDPVSKSGSLIAILWGFVIIFVLSGYAVSVFFSLNVNKVVNEIQSVEDLQKVKVGTIEKSSSFEYLKANGIKATGFTNFEKLFAALENEEVDAIVHDEPILRYYIFDNNLMGKVQVLPVKFNTQYYSFSVPHLNDLQFRVNPVLFSEMENGQTKEILKKYNLEE